MFSCFVNQIVKLKNSILCQKINGYLTIEKNIDDKTEKELRSIARAIVKANNRIIKLGYISYLSAHGSWNIVDGETHKGIGEPDQSVVVASFSIDRIDAGDW
jgi:hypothetical protein